LPAIPIVGATHQFPVGINSWQSISAKCDMTNRGWTIINPQKDANWYQYFSTYRTVASNTMIIPNVLPIQNSWKSWFIMDKPETVYRLSADCNTCLQDYPSNEAYTIYRRLNGTTENGTNSSRERKNYGYYITGDYFGCGYLNTKCGENPTTANCSICDEGKLGTPSHSSCRHWALEADYSYAYDCATGNWCVAPTIGIAGNYCVCYRSIAFGEDEFPPAPISSHAISSSKPKPEDRTWVYIGSATAAAALIILILVAIFMSKSAARKRQAKKDEMEMQQTFLDEQQETDSRGSGGFYQRVKGQSGFTTTTSANEI